MFSQNSFFILSYYRFTKLYQSGKKWTGSATLFISPPNSNLPHLFYSPIGQYIDALLDVYWSQAGWLICFQRSMCLSWIQVNRTTLLHILSIFYRLGGSRFRFPIVRWFKGSVDVISFFRFPTLNFNFLVKGYDPRNPLEP